MFERYQLPNGADICLIPIKDARSITTLVMFPVGSRYEPSSLSGVSHYIEHLMFKGTKKRPTTLKLTREIDRLGAEYNAFTGKEYTGYYIKADVQYTETSMDILSDMLFHSQFDPKEMEREKGVIVEEIRMYRDNPLMHIDSVCESVLFQGALGRDIAGTEKHVLGYKRDAVLAYRDTYYQPSNMMVIVAGAVTEHTKKLVESYFGVSQDTRAVGHKFAPAVYGSARIEDRLHIEHKPTDQVQMMIGFPGFAYADKRLPVQSVMNAILGGSMSSRLFIQIRERRGLAYMVRSGADQFRDAGYAYVRAGLEAKNVSRALSVIKSEIAKIVDKGVTPKELADAKTHIRGSFSLSLEDSSTQANYYATRMLFYPSIETPEEYLKHIESVTNDDIKRVAKKLFSWKQARLAIVGNVDSDTITW